MILIYNPLKTHIMNHLIIKRVLSVYLNVMYCLFGHCMCSGGWISLFLKGFDLSMWCFGLSLADSVIVDIAEKHSIFTCLYFLVVFKFYLGLTAEMALFVELCGYFCGKVFKILKVSLCFINFILIFLAESWWM